MSLPANTLPEFRTIRRYAERTTGRSIVQVLPGEYYVTRADEVVTTILGSCVAACICDPGARIGGLNHFMLPAGKMTGAWSEATRYGCYAVERLINVILKHGGRRSALQIKVFGGGRVMAEGSDVGRSNVEFIHEYLRAEGLPIFSEDVLGHWGRRLRYEPLTGRALVKRLSPHESWRTASNESELSKKLARTPLAGDVELF